MDNDEIAEQLFNNSSSPKNLGYDKSTTLGQIIDDYPEVDIENLKLYNLEIKKVKLPINDMVKLGSLSIGFDENTYSETPIYKTVRKYNYYSGDYYNAKEFVKMDKKIETTSPVTFASLDFILESSGKSKGKTLADAIKTQAMKAMKVTEIENIEVKNTDLKGIYLLKNNDLFIYIRYNQDIDAKPSLAVAVVNQNYDKTFDELAKDLIDKFNK